MTTATRLFYFIIFLFCVNLGIAQVQQDDRMYEIIENSSADRIQSDIEKLVSFGTRHTLSDTVSTTRGIGAARRWIKAEFENISSDCGGCLEVKYQSGDVKPGESRRIPEGVHIVNVMAIKRGTVYPDRYIIMSGDIDSRVSNPLNATDDSPGANDNASGIAGVLEASRILSKYDFATSIIFVGLSGEEQGLFGGQIMAKEAKDKGWDIIGILNNDMIGNIHGIDGVIDNSTFRVFSQAAPPDENEQKRIWKRFYGGEVDGPSRQLARYVEKMTSQYMTNLRAIMIYRLDRFGRGGHHKPFNDAGFPGVRIMETHENYNMQHQDIRVEDGIAYGDVIDGVDFDYASKLTAVNAITLAGIAWAPKPPEGLMIGGAVQPSTRLKWDKSNDKHVKGYKIYWRDTTSPQWQYSRYVGNVSEFTLKGIVIDNYLFGVAAVSADGNESVVTYPSTLIPRR
ncbi:M28 family metallopeptidase [Portibacter lacus]|uniref:Peptidase M28 n=1 Tax=Portibacter lacus TaxID=1099794 RepID=A0AA37SK64_9BACT|nr:M28 family metallopeptidase [Portibacter lacus]GLR15520.1 peptidase M28 [Portibacter lacus]